MLIFLFLIQLDYGYLNLKADMDSLPIYVDNEFIGKTPIIKYPLRPAEYNVGFFPQDSIEDASWKIKSGSLGALWKIAKYGEGTCKVRISPNIITTVNLNYKKTMRAPRKAKLMVGGCLGGTFILGVLTTLAVQAIF
jgi:hypothetical protein